MGSGENGIQYRCDFTGQFTQPVRVNDYTYSVRIDEITYEKEAGTDEVIGVTHYYYTDPYGLEDAEDILIYLPGAPLGQLPQEFRSWVGYSENTRDELPFYALNNAVHQQGFSSYDRLESIRESLEGWVEPYAAELETEITSGSSQGCVRKRPRGCLSCGMASSTTCGTAWSSGWIRRSWSPWRRNRRLGPPGRRSR